MKKFKINPDTNKKHLLADGIKCPNCGAYFSEHTYIGKTETLFVQFEGPCYMWYEFHVCTKCETKYYFKNST